MNVSGPEPLLGAAPTAPPLVVDHFRADRAGSIAEEDLRRVLDAPVFLEQEARVGVLQVTGGYGADDSLPLTGVPAVLAEGLDQTGLFEATTEISADWPAERGLSGLRELAARYRAEYLLLYRHRFVGRAWTNAWGWLHLTLIGGLLTPSRTVQQAGVLEATLFDVRTGTILFTVFERVDGQTRTSVWSTGRARRELSERLVRQAARRLAASASAKVGLLAASRPGLAAAPPLAVGP